MTPTLVFLPGLGADHRLFKHQTAAFPNSYAADWIDPLPGERLEQYAVRFAEKVRTELDKRPSAPVVVCGLSLGGMIAPYVARELGASACILFCTVRESRQFPRQYYLDWQLMRLCPPLRLVRLFFLRPLVRLLLLFPRLLQCFVDPKVVLAMVETPLGRFAGLSRMMFDWAYRRRTPDENGTKIFDGPTLHVHGTKDRLLPIRRTNPDIRIEGGGHLLVLTHPEKINELVERFVAALQLD